MKTLFKDMVKRKTKFLYDKVINGCLLSFEGIIYETITIDVATNVHYNQIIFNIIILLLSLIILNLLWLR